MLANFPCPVNGTFHKFTCPKRPYPHRFVGNFTKGRPFAGSIVTDFIRLPEVCPFRGKNMLPVPPAALQAIPDGGSCPRLSSQKPFIVAPAIRQGLPQVPWNLGCGRGGSDCAGMARAPCSAAHPIICAGSGGWDAAPVCTGATPGAVPAPASSVELCAETFNYAVIAFGRAIKYDIHRSASEE